MKLTIELPDEICQAAAENLGWTATIKQDDKQVTNPVTCDQFCTSSCVKLLSDNYSTKKRNDASTVAMAAADVEVQAVLKDI